MMSVVRHITDQLAVMYLTLACAADARLGARAPTHLCRRHSWSRPGHLRSPALVRSAVPAIWVLIGRNRVGTWYLCTSRCAQPVRARVASVSRSTSQPSKNQRYGRATDR